MKSIHKAILLNKTFSGGWLDEDDAHIGHEIIDLILSDSGEHYVYYCPWGSVPKNVVVENDTHFRSKKGKEYEAKYLVLSGNYHKNTKNVEILYVIELEEKLHNLSFTKDTNDEEAINAAFNTIKTIIDDRNITYNGKPLYAAYPKYDADGQRDKSLFLTFKAKRIYKPTRELFYKFNKSIIRGNKFTIKDDGEYKDDYSSLSKFISDNIRDNTLTVFTPNSLLETQINSYRPTFFDLIDYGDVEQAFTNILCSVLKQGDMMKRFCEKFKKTDEVLSVNTFKVDREQKVVDGRMDVCAVSVDQKVVIENKINSGLNGVKVDSCTQLSSYYLWGNHNKVLAPLCFLTFPDIYREKIIKEIRAYDPLMENYYNLVTYGDIANFLEENKHDFPTSYEFHKYYDDIVSAFRNHSFKTKEQYYAQKFYRLTLETN